MNKSFFKSKHWYNFRREPGAVIGSLIMVLFFLAAMFAPMIAPQNPYDLTEVSLEHFLLPPVWMENGQMPFVFGTDDQGRDIFSTILYGCRTSLIVGFGVLLLAGSAGVFLGMLSGYYGGRLDAFIMRAGDTVLCFSTSLLALFFLGIMGQRGVTMVIIAICISGWVRYARTMRGSTLGVKQEAYIMAARATGASDPTLLLKHLLPNALAPIFVVMAVDLAVVIGLEATLSFLGVGVPLTEPSLGMMIANGRDYVYTGMWWMVLFPAGALIMLVVGINLFADWLREELNPKISRKT
ncbi:MAG: ABC transporter permease [Desulfobacteraceae bacterium]|nr:ABC transporter permease [Desulfobacteraceae bacterium]